MADLAPTTATTLRADIECKKKGSEREQTFRSAAVLQAFDPRKDPQGALGGVLVVFVGGVVLLVLVVLLVTVSDECSFFTLAGLLLWQHYSGNSLLERLKSPDFHTLRLTDLDVESGGRIFKRLCLAVGLDPKTKLLSILRPSGAIELSKQGLEKHLVDTWGGWGTTDASSTVCQESYLNKSESSMLKVLVL
jgi:hypothetical protein